MAPITIDENNWKPLNLNKLNTIEENDGDYYMI